MDPASPFSGGALLGDRVRMTGDVRGRDCFFRSMSAGDAMGGLARATQDAARVLDASGRQIILIETVGVGRSELDVAQATDTVLVVLTPESGDTIQVMKAGLLEIADVFAINKADREGARRMKTELQAILAMKPGEAVPVILTQGHKGLGIDELYLEVERLRLAQEVNGQLEERRRRRRREEFLELIQRRVRGRFLEFMEKDVQLRDLTERVVAGEVDPYSACAQVLDDRHWLAKWLPNEG